MRTRNTPSTETPCLSRQEHLQLIWQVMDQGNLKKGFALTNATECADLTFSVTMLWKLSERGIPTASLEPFGKFIGLSKTDVADYVELDRTTIKRRLQAGGLLPRHSSENVLRLLEIESMVSETFGDANSCAWLHKKHPMLDGITPIEAAKTSYGSQRVKDLLIATKYGGVL